MPQVPDAPSRRAVLGAALAAGAGGSLLVPARAVATGDPATSLVTGLVAPVTEAAERGELARSLRYPFTLGVASGDPSAGGIVLWTRLAPEPMAPDGRAGMPDRSVEVAWQVAEDALFRSVVRTGTALAVPGEAHSVHVELRDLAADAEYFYRFRTGLHFSPVGRTRTAPAAGSRAPLTFAVSSCAHYEHGYFTAYRHIADARPDLILHLGDYIYNSAAGSKAPESGTVRFHDGEQTRSVADFRRRHAQYKSDPDLQAAHAAAPWIATIDDHEVTNNWAGRFKTDPAAQREFAAIRNAALQVYWEHMPLPISARPASGGWQLYRRLAWGALASFHVLDTRQYRSAPACGRKRVVGECAERSAEDRTMLGPEQEAWLTQGLASSGADWDFVAQQVFFSSRTLPVKGINTDTWEGYTAARVRLLDAAAAGGVRNLAVLTGDAHLAWAAHVLRDFTDFALAPVGVELVASSLTTNGNGTAVNAKIRKTLKALPHITFGDQRRGWIQVNATPARLRADFLAMPYVDKPGATPETAATFEVAAGSPLLRRL